MPHLNPDKTETMKKFVFIFLAVLIAGCSVFQKTSPEGAPLQTTATNTRPPRPTKTLAPPTSTFTLTPTLVALQVTKAVLGSTETPSATVTPLIYLTPNTPTQTVMMEGFLTVSVFGTEFYKDPQCQPDSIKFVVQVADPTRSEIVDLFVRFKSKRAGVEGKWTRITMQNIGAGTFTHILTAGQILEFEIFRSAWVQYQFISSTRAGREVGRTAIFSENLSMPECILTPTPSITPTATVLKP